MGEMVYLCRLSEIELKHTIENVSHDITKTLTDESRNRNLEKG